MPTLLTAQEEGYQVLLSPWSQFLHLNYGVLQGMALLSMDFPGFQGIDVKRRCVQCTEHFYIALHIPM